MRKRNRIKGRIKRKLDSRSGFTMSEMMMTVVIIAILGGLIVAAVIRYQQALALTERDGIAKQLFIAAQNHITMAKGEGYLGVTSGPDAGFDNDSHSDVYGYKLSDGSCIFVQDPNNSSYKGENNTLLDQMLPIGSIEETVRTKGSYIIHYQPETGKILDVFYCTPGNDRFDYTLTKNDYTSAMGYVDPTDQKDKRRDFKDGGEILGWYGGAGLDPIPVALRTPTIEVENGEQLKVTVTDRNLVRVSGSSIALMVKGLDVNGQGEAAIMSSDSKRCNANAATGVYEFIIDDISTEGLHFCQLNSQNDKYFIAGEDILVYAMSYSNSQLSTIAHSEEVKVNSLYDSISQNAKARETDPVTYTAYISKCRHLENLEEDISDTGMKTGTMASSKDITLTAAAQTANLVWNNTTVYDKTGATNASGGTGYWPVSYTTELIYDGLRHSIKDITSSGYENAGVFGILGAGSAVKDLKLINTEIVGMKDKGSAGALAGSATSTKIQNVVAYHEHNKGADTKISGYNVGGLVGSMSGGAIRYSAASHLIHGKASAGGLVGTTSTGTSIRTSYSGGHTTAGIYDIGANNYNVIADNGPAGGLVGSAGNASFKWCYSTCSVDGRSGSTGGFVGTSSGSINSCYSTGLVGGNPENGKADNAFVGSDSDCSISGNNYYYEMINRNVISGVLSYKGTGASGNNADHFTSIDDSSDIYNAFVAQESTWNEAVVYDDFLVNHYRNHNSTAYPLKTVTQLMASGNKTRITAGAGKYFVNTHYGDWPSPEMFIVN